jgi:hypothetical protein
MLRGDKKTLSLGDDVVTHVGSCEQSQVEITHTSVLPVYREVNMYVISLVGVVVWISALAIAWGLWSKFYVKVMTKGEMSRDNYKRFIIQIGALGVWFAVGWTLFGG